MRRQKRVAILQSSYIPWKGYFDIINSVDEFILYDDRQYTTNDWRNRNRIKSPNGSVWLTIPIRRRWPQRIDEAETSDATWPQRHWQTITQNYSRASYFSLYAPGFEAIYRSRLPERLSEINRTFITAVCAALHIKTVITSSAAYAATGTSTERVVSLCTAAGATDYLSGPSARDYIEPELFDRAGIQLHWMDYSGYLEYPQPYPPFNHAVSILDLIFCTGDEAPRYMKSFNGR